MFGSFRRKTKRIIILFSAIVLFFAAFIIYMLRRGTGFYTLPPGQVNDVTSETFHYPEGAWYTVENKRFGIDNTGKNARRTTDGINEALVWAKSNGYENIKFPAGTYLIQCNWDDRFSAPDDGILVPSGLTLDLGSSVFKIEPNDHPEYCIFGIIDKSDINIIGGVLTGDIDSHIYSPSADSPTHEFGFGICVSASSNIRIEGVTISGMTGDGIMLEGSYEAIEDGGAVSSDVIIYNCDISHCRRQGISIIGAIDSEVVGNRIYDIGGTDPQYGIDVETEFDHTAGNTRICGNMIYGCRGGAISCKNSSGYFVYGNTCKGNNIIAVECSDVEIYGNIIESSFIQVYDQAEDIRVFNNQFDIFSRLIMGN